MPTELTLKTMNAVHRILLGLSRGRLGWTVANMPALELTTTGRRSGAAAQACGSTSPVHEGPVLVVVASRGGDDHAPAWFLNLVDDPDVEVSWQGAPSARMRARVASAEERERLWPLVIADHANYAAYQTKTAREIPLVLLEPPAACPTSQPMARSRVTGQLLDALGDDVETEALGHRHDGLEQRVALVVGLGVGHERPVDLEDVDRAAGADSRSRSSRCRSRRVRRALRPAATPPSGRRAATGVGEDGLGDLDHEGCGSSLVSARDRLTSSAKPTPLELAHRDVHRQPEVWPPVPLLPALQLACRGLEHPRADVDDGHPSPPRPR